MEIGVTMLACLFLIESSSKLLVTRTGIKARTSLILGRIRLLTLEFIALEWWKFYTSEPEYLWGQLANLGIMGKWCLHASLFVFDRIIIKVAGNQDRHKSSVEFDFGLNQTTHFGVTCPWSNFMCNIIGVGERLHKVLGQIGSKLWFPWQQTAPIYLWWGKWCLLKLSIACQNHIVIYYNIEILYCDAY